MSKVESTESNVKSQKQLDFNYRLSILILVFKKPRQT